MGGYFCWNDDWGMGLEGNVPARGGNDTVYRFRVPRAGGGTAPVPPGESHLLRQQQKDTLAVSFCYDSYDFYTRSRRKIYPFYAKMPI